MSVFRYNEKELISYAVTKEDAVIKGPLKKVSKKSKSKYLWIVIKSNLLFVFKSHTEPAPGHGAHSCYVLEACYPELTDVGFKVIFNDSVRTSFLAFICGPEQAVIWVQTIKQANFKYLRNCIVYYKSLLSKLQNHNSLVEHENTVGIAAFIFRIQGLQIFQSDCEIQIQVFDEHRDRVMKTSSNLYEPNEIVFFETLLLDSSKFRSLYEVCIMRTSSASKQPCHINISSTSICPWDILCSKTEDTVKEYITPIEGPNACGILTVGVININEAITSVTKQSNHRSSCLFSESIQPLPMEDKDQLFSTIFSSISDKYYIVNPSATINGSPINLLHESLLKLNCNSNITVSYLDFLLRNDSDLLKSMNIYNNNSHQVASVRNLEFRIDVNNQHKKCLEDVFGKINRHRSQSLKRSGYQTLYFPSNLTLYQSKIMDTSFERYEIFEKTILSTPTKKTDHFKEGGLYSMLCDDHIKNAFYLCKKFTLTKDKMMLYTQHLNNHLALIAYSLANSNLDELARHFKDYEAVSHSLISICSSAEVADLVIELAVALGEETSSSLYVWLNNKIVYIDHAWSVASNFRDLKSQIEQLSISCAELINDYRSDLWVELIFLPCNKFQRDLGSLISVSSAGLDFKIHCIQNVSSAMNRFLMRVDAVSAQLLLALITTIYSSIYVYMDDVFFWLQLLNIGFFVQIESLLSCCGTERVLLEDIYIATELLKFYKIEIVCKDESITMPRFSGCRYNLLISIPVPTRIYALLLDVCQGHSNRQLSILPVFCNQIISKTNATVLSDSETRFIKTINTNSVDYVKKILDKNTVFYHSIEDSGKCDNLYLCLSKLRKLYQSPNKPSEILPLFQQLGKLLCAGQIVTCVNGIDNAAMSVTYNLVHYLQTNYTANSEDFQHVLNSLRQGLFLNRAGALRSYDHYIWQGEMFPSYQH